MVVDEKEAIWVSEYNGEYNGKTYFFFASGCKKAFDKKPENYI